MDHNNSVSDQYPYCLIRISSKQYIENLYYKGEIYMNTVDYYRKCNNNLQVGDRLEGPSYYYGPGQISLDLPNGVSIPVNIKSFETWFNQNINLYCLFGITQYEVNEAQSMPNISLYPLKDFGNYMCIIRDPETFIKRISAKLEELGYHSYICRRVEYVDKGYQGEITPYMKRDIYRHQHEIRFVVDNTVNEPLKFEIGSIEDISMIMPFDGNVNVQFKPL
jgi:hypothetical protein